MLPLVQLLTYIRSKNLWKSPRPIEEPVEKPTVADPNIIPLAPRVITVDKHTAYPKAIADLKAIGVLPQAVELRQVKYLNNIVEQDHRFIQRRV